jgi:hypothetical protein
MSNASALQPKHEIFYTPDCGLVSKARVTVTLAQAGFEKNVSSPPLTVNIDPRVNPTPKL